MNRVDNEDEVERKMKKKFIKFIKSKDNINMCNKNINKSKNLGSERITARIITIEFNMICKKQYALISKSEIYYESN